MLGSLMQTEAKSTGIEKLERSAGAADDQCVKEADDDGCLQTSPGWDDRYTCDLASKAYCDSWPKDMLRCCQTSCGKCTDKASCDKLVGYGTCIYSVN